MQRDKLFHSLSTDIMRSKVSKEKNMQDKMLIIELTGWREDHKLYFWDWNSFN